MTIEDRKVYELVFNIRLSPIERLFRKNRIEDKLEKLRKDIRFGDPHARVIVQNVNGLIIVTARGSEKTTITKTEQFIENNSG